MSDKATTTAPTVEEMRGWPVVTAGDGVARCCQMRVVEARLYEDNSQGAQCLNCGADLRDDYHVVPKPGASDTLTPRERYLVTTAFLGSRGWPAYSPEQWLALEMPSGITCEQSLAKGPR